jgi:hypothetical protein
MMVPFADCINHHNVDSSYEMVRKCWPPLSLEQRKAKYCDIWRQREEIKEANKIAKLEDALMGTEKEEKKAKEQPTLIPGGPEAYHTSLKAQIDYKDFYGEYFRVH